MVPSDSPISLDTTSLDILFPGIDQIYGSNLPVQLDCSADENIPYLGINSEGLVGHISGFCNVEVYTNQSWVLVLVMNTKVSFSGDISIQDYTVYPNITNAEFGNITITNSEIADINTIELEDLLNLILELSIPSINQAWLLNGIPIPSIPGTYLGSAEITLHDGYFKIGATPIFSPEFAEVILAPNQNMKSKKVRIHRH